MPAFANFSPNVGDARASSLMFPTFVPAVDATAAAITYSLAQLFGGLILRNTNGGSRADLLPPAADIIRALNGPMVGMGFEFTIRQTSAGAETITVTTNTGLTLSGTMTIGQNNSKRFLIVFTNITPGSEAATVYSLGTSVH